MNLDVWKLSLQINNREPKGKKLFATATLNEILKPRLQTRDLNNLSAVISAIPCTPFP